MIWYICGPMTNKPYFNVEAFDTAAKWLLDLGHEYVNPADHDREVYGTVIFDDPDGDPAYAKQFGFRLNDALAWDLNQIAHVVDGVCVLPGWEVSKGGLAEVALAQALKKPVVRLQDIASAVSNFDEVLDRDYYLDSSISITTLPQPVAPITEVERRREAMDRLVEASAGMYVCPDEDPNQPVTIKTLPGGEVRTTSSTGGQKGVKVERHDLVPPAPLRALATHYGVGARKYDDNQWRKGYEWSKSYGALLRHLHAWYEGEDLDEETGSNHLTAVAWHAFALYQFTIDHPQFDDRPRFKREITVKELYELININ